MMTAQDWNLVQDGVWAAIISVTLRQFLETKKPVKGNGMRILLGDILMIAPLPWIISCMANRATLSEVIWPILMGLALSVPYIMTTKFVLLPNGNIRYKKNYLFYVVLLSFPYLRFLGRKQYFHQHPVFFEHTHIPDIELMLAMYVLIIVVSTAMWRIVSYVKFRRVSITQQSMESRPTESMVASRAPHGTL